MTNRNTQTIGGNTSTDVGLRNFMLGTYRYMAAAMAVTAAVAYLAAPFIAQSGLMRSPFMLLGFIIAIPLLFGAVGSKLQTMSLGGVLAFLFGFSAFLGIFVSAITLVYPGVVLAKVFFMTVAMFGALSFFGHTTERDLSTFVKYAFAAFLAYVAISVLGMFFPALRPTGPLDTIISIVALGAIAVITAWETQMLKRVYYSVAGNAAMEGKMAAYGAASLLLAFVNMFQILLSLFGRE